MSTSPSTPSPESAPASTVVRIAELNDLCRKGRGINIRRKITCGITALPMADQLTIISKVVSFGAFDPEDNPYGERDFGAFTHNDGRIFWKIDYYDPSIEYGSDDPSDPHKTVRVLTIMLASEY